ncbi:MAG: fatty acid desaturase [Candidatus Omnitrophica bacterium]|nr:fatty acid desaturase [Candidatus Omnitrophota bacterium]
MECPASPLEPAMESPAPLTRQELNRGVVALKHPNHTTNLYYLAQEYLFLALAIGLPIAFFRWTRSLGYPLWVNLPGYLVSIFFIGAIQHRLSNLTHEAGHYALFKNRYMNELVSDLCCIFLLGATTQNYRVSHWGHHAYVNDPEKDPDLIRLKQHQEYDFPMAKGRFCLLYVILQMLPKQSLKYLWGRAKIAVLGINEGAFAETKPVYGSMPTTLLRIAYYSAGIALLTWQGWWIYLLLFWIVPIVTFYPLFMLLREIAHHTNVPDNSTYRNSRVFRPGWLEGFCIFPYGQAYHLPHHLFPSVPHYRLDEAHELAMRYPEYRNNTTICGGFFLSSPMDRQMPTVLDLLSQPA